MAINTVYMNKLLPRLLGGMCLFMAAPPYAIRAQSLIANSQLDDDNICVEYNARCAPEAWWEANFGPTHYIKGAKGGKVGIKLSNNPNMRTVMVTQLLCPLMAGQEYKVTIDLNLRGSSFYPFGLWLSEADLTEHFRVDTVVATLVLTEKNALGKIKKMDWVPFEGQFQARGGETFLYVGMMGPPTKDRRDWYFVAYIDNITLTPVGDSYPLCDEATATQTRLYARDRRHGSVPEEYVPIEQAPVPEELEPVEEVEEEPELLAVPTVRQPDTLLLSGVCFDFNKSTLNAHYAAITDSLVEKIMARHPQKILINGHTDNIGTDEFNLNLSLARAHTAASVLVGKGFPAEKIVCEGKGESLPVANNDTETGRAANRRIEFVLW